MVTADHIFLVVVFDDGHEHMITADPSALRTSALEFIDDLERQTNRKVRYLIPSPMPPLSKAKEGPDDSDDTTH
jgi:hypothetical protein